MRLAGTFVMVGLLVAGCSDPGDDPPDPTPDAGVRPDAGDDEPDAGEPGGAGLTFRFASRPSLPGELEGEYNPEIDEVELLLVQVRAIGDSSPGGEGTSADLLELSWEDDGAEELRFPQAPPGIYSQLMAEIQSYELEGTVEISGDEVPFRIAEESASIQVSLSLDGLELEPGMDAVVSIHVDVGDVIQAIEWDEVPVDEEGWLHVSPESAQGAAIREVLANSFDTGDDDNSGPGDGSGDGSGG
jgi:hypothetical protein